MLSEALPAVPAWLATGLVVGALASVVAACAFVVGERLFPTPPVDPTDRIDGDERRRAEIRASLRAIGEPFVEDATVHGHRISFYLPARDVAITFDPHAFFRLRETDTHAVLCEAEMPAAQLGRRLPFDVAAEAAAVADVSDHVAAAFDRLELPRSADASTVRSAYRERVKEVHPDRGGDVRAFRRLREAYETAAEYARE